MPSFLPLALLLALPAAGCCCRSQPPPPRKVPSTVSLQETIKRELAHNATVASKLCGLQGLTGLSDSSVEVVSAPSHDQIRVRVTGKAASNEAIKPLICGGALLLTAYVIDSAPDKVELDSVKVVAVTTAGVVFTPSADPPNDKAPRPSSGGGHHHWG